MADGFDIQTLQNEAHATRAALSAAERAVVAEMGTVWSKIIMEVVPDTSATTLRLASHLAQAPLGPLMADNQATISALRAARADLQDEVLSEVEFSQVERRRHVLGQRLNGGLRRDRRLDRRLRRRRPREPPPAKG